MKLATLVEALALRPLTTDVGIDNEVTGGYVGDLLSRVMARSQAGNIWVTVQAHPNVVAVAMVVGLSAVVIAEGAVVDPVTIEKAQEQRIPLFVTSKSAFTVVSGLAAAGVGAHG